MMPPAANADHSPASRLRRWGAGAAVVGVLALGGFFGWPWFQDRAQRRQALAVAERDGFEAAQSLLRRVHERHPEDVPVLRALALGYLHARKFADAETFLDRWCALRPAEAEPYRQRLALWTKQQQVAPAIADAESILRFEPNDFQTRWQLVQLLTLDGRYEQAEQEGLRCFKAQPKNVEGWFLLAVIYHGQGRAALAADLADQVLRTVPDHLGGLKLRAQLYLDAGQPEPAIRLLKQVVSGSPSPDGTEGLYELSMALARAGRDAEARQVLAERQWRQALGLWSEYEHRDENPGLQERVVETMLAAGKTADAISFLQDILKRNPRAPAGTHQLLAGCYQKQGRPELAAEERRRAGLKP